MLFILNNEDLNIIIIGTGLTGLTLAYLLRETKANFVLLESRDRIGGRIHTIYNDSVSPMEMGATWLGRKHRHLNQLIKELDLEIFEQELSEYAFYEPSSHESFQFVQLPLNDEPSYRIKGGTSKLIKSLNQFVEKERIILNQSVESIQRIDHSVVVKTQNNTFRSSIVISTLPPSLLVNNIQIVPPLPTEINNIAHNTHTWMSASIKIALTYSEAFWREPSLSGTIFSNAGPITEMYDHSNYERSFFSLMGFLDEKLYSLSKAQRRALVFDQLHKYYGIQANRYLGYYEFLWRNDTYCYNRHQAELLPHYNNGHRAYQQNYWKNRLYIAGTETAKMFPGYMDGAIESAKHVFSMLVEFHTNLLSDK